MGLDIREGDIHHFTLYDAPKDEQHGNYISLKNDRPLYEARTQVVDMCAGKHFCKYYSCRIRILFLTPCCVVSIIYKLCNTLGFRFTLREFNLHTFIACTMYIIQCTLYTVQCTLCKIQCTGYIVHCT